MTNAPTNSDTTERLELEEAVVRTGQEVRRLLKSAPVLIRSMTAHLSRASGKMIRARALLVCAIGNDGMICPDAVNVASAVELLHMATLVHDDIIDNAEKRRGIDTLQKKFGEKYAVLCGDFLFCAALEIIAKTEWPPQRKNTPPLKFSRYMTDICLGELRQNQNINNFGLTEREYFKIIKGKTAALFEASLYAGFIYSDEPEGLMDVYKEIGYNIGIMFQLADDCADYTSTLKTVKKPVLSDCSRGVVTLPLIYALKQDSSLASKIKAKAEPKVLKEAVYSAGGLDYTYQKINKYYKKTEGLIKRLNITDQKRQLLTGLLKKASGVY